MSKRTIRCCSRTLVLIVAVLVLGAGAALAQTHPVGVNIQKICPFFVNQGETYQCSFSLQNNDTSHGIINLHVFESHPPVTCATNQMTPCTGEIEVACVGGPTANSLATNGTAGDTCTGTLPDFTAPITCSTDPNGFQDTDRIRSTGNDAGIPALAATGSADNGPVVRALICPADTNECTSDICTPGIGCEHPNLPDSDPCTDSDANACTTAGCEAGVCVQAHNETVCTPDTNECTSDPACDPATGLCEHPNLPDSDPCTDSDANACTTPGCEAGVCVQAHNETVCTPDTNECTSDPACDPATGLCEHPAVPDSDPCTDSDQNACTTPGCEAGACVQTHQETVCTPDTNECTSDPACDPATGLCEHPAVPDSDPCTDSDANACTTPGCEAGACVQTHQETVCTPDTNECTSDPACDPATGLCEHPNLPDSDPCTDTDQLSCTTAGCEAGVCVQTHVEDCAVDEICRTPGFWGTHGGSEKGGPNITQAVLNETGPISICGVTISTTDLTATSAIEAICVSPKGQQTLQLARQLTAAALNCGMTNSVSCGGGGQNPGTNICGGVSIEDVFNACNEACAAGLTSPASGDFAGISCIEAIDCFNNGGSGLDAEGVCTGDSGCHDRPLVNGCFNFQNPGPASSPKKCNDARKDPILVISP